MHIEPPSRAPTNFKELLVHYVMIVLGILTALGLEAGFEAIHHHRLANETVEQVEAELRANLADVRAALAHNRDMKAAADKMYGEVADLVRNDQARPEALKAMLLQRLRVSVATPGLRRDAWDTAVADQALMHMPHATLRRLAEAYTAQRDTQQVAQASLSIAGSLTRLTDAVVDAEVGRVDPVQLLKALQSYRVTLSATLGAQQDLQRALAQAVDESADGAAAGASAAAPH